MVSNKTFDASRDGKVSKLRIAAGDITVSRLLRAFQASTHCIYIWIIAKSPNDMTATVQDYVILSKSQIVFNCDYLASSCVGGEIFNVLP